MTSALLLFAVDSPAATDAATRHFQSGNTAFQAGDYTKALSSFEAALAAGMTGPAVHFNIGVAAYRLGNYSRAETAFQEVARTPAMAGLAHYNLGLVEVARNNSTAASHWFSQVGQTTDDQRLRELASTRLAELQPQPSAPARAWFGYAAFGLGYDDNVALVSNSDVLGISDTEDSFAELQAALSTPLADDWRLDGGLMLTDYQDLDEFDQLSVYGGPRYRWRVEQWANDASLRLSYSLLDGSGFENRRTLAVQTRRDLRSDIQMRARYRLHHIDGMNEYSGLSGLRHEASATVDWTYAEWNVDVRYQLELADYDDARLSATRHELRLDVAREVASNWAVLFEAAHRHSDYDSDVNGSEQRIDLALSVIRTLSARWRVVVRHAYTQNSADLAAYDYRGNRVSAGIEAIL